MLIILGLSAIADKASLITLSFGSSADLAVMASRLRFPVARRG